VGIDARASATSILSANGPAHWREESVYQDSQDSWELLLALAKFCPFEFMAQVLRFHLLPLPMGFFSEANGLLLISVCPHPQGRVGHT
jgi:hypothetical protein